VRRSDRICLWCRDTESRRKWHALGIEVGTPPPLKLRKYVIMKGLYERYLRKYMKMGDLWEGMQKTRKPLNLKDLGAYWA
jgi:hypothetical protein